MVQIGNLFFNQISVTGENGTETIKFDENATIQDFQNGLIKLMEKANPGLIQGEHFFKVELKGKQVIDKIKKTPFDNIINKPKNK